MPPLPEPLEVPWTMKPLESAVTKLETLDDGRLHLSIEHDLLLGVTPEMLVWWFQNLEGDMELEGRRVSRYRVWHPRDHVSFRYARRTRPVGPGAIFALHEVLGRNPEWVVDVRTLVTQLDERGFAHRPRLAGLPLARMDYRFERTAGGTRYVNSLTFGLAGARWRSRPTRQLNAALRRRFFSDAKGRAWLLHNVEEVGNFEFFLPALHARETGRPIEAAVRGG